jgi:5,10-methylenetetrahydromethanopterin reductase
VHEYVGVVYDRSPEVRDRTRALLRALDVDLKGAEKPLV